LPPNPMRFGRWASSEVPTVICAHDPAERSHCHERALCEVSVDEETAEGRERVYWPDAVVLLRDGRELLVEVKPRALFGKPKDMAKWRAAALWCRRNSVGFAVVVPVRGHVLGDIFARRVQLGVGGLRANLSVNAAGSGGSG
jgi:hypothetical protein